jgi:sugar phosphate isomerase/epimerase
MTQFNYQLYSSRNHGPLAQTLKMLADAGYAGVEGYDALFAGLDEAGLRQFRADLDAVGLAMPSGHFGLDMIEQTPDKVIAIARALNISAVYCPYIAPELRPTDSAGWHEFGARLARAGTPIKAAGLRFGWHNHDFELVPLADGSIPLDHLFAAAPDLEWEADIAWVVRGGADAFEWIARMSDRISAVHVKDIAPAGEKLDEDGWADVGTGTLPWGDLMAALAKTKAQYFVMEHDNPSDAARFARASIAATQNF